MHMCLYLFRVILWVQLKCICIQHTVCKLYPKLAFTFSSLCNCTLILVMLPCAFVFVLFIYLFLQILCCIYLFIFECVNAWMNA